MDPNNEKDQGSWYVDEPKNNSDQSGQGQGSNSGSDPDRPDDDEIIRRVYIRIEPNTMLLTVSMVLGILSVATAVLGTVYLPFILGGIAIVMGILSRDESGITEFKAKLGILLGTFGIVLNIVVVGTSVYSVLTNPDRYEEFDSVFERVYGQDFSSFMEEQGFSVSVPE